MSIRRKNDFYLNEEQVVWQEVVHDFVARTVKPLARQVDEDGQINLEVLRKMVPLGLLGLATPEEFGGPGVDAISAASCNRRSWLGLRKHCSFGGRPQWSRLRPIGFVWQSGAKTGHIARCLQKRETNCACAYRTGGGRTCKVGCKPEPSAAGSNGFSTVRKCGSPTPVLPIISLPLPGWTNHQVAIL